MDTEHGITRPGFLPLANHPSGLPHVPAGTRNWQLEMVNGGAEIQVYRDNELAITWTDSTPLMSGSYLVLRTNNSQVAFDDVQANEVALSYLHGDHLGSNSLMTDAAGTIVPNSQAAYLPFGDWRNEPSTANLTDLGYTGHRHNNTATNDLGLIYMNARYYLPGTGRFASADTIVPDPNNPQSYNRYSYVLNTPTRYTDPTGHVCYDPELDATTTGNCNGESTPLLPPPPPEVTQLWIDPENVEAIQLYGNTNFGFNLDGSGPSYAYSQGFHGGLDLIAEPGTEVVAGIHGTVEWISDWTAYQPRYIVIKIAPDTYMVIGHLSAENTSNLVAGNTVTPDTVVGTVEGTQEHVHIEFWTGTGSNIQNRKIEVPYQYMSTEVKNQFFALSLNMDEEDSSITFFNRTDGMWSSTYDQPTLIYNGTNLNDGQPGYDNPWD